MAKAKRRIILVGGEKGGTGKTTLATNLAAMRAADGRDVLLVDADQQGSASGWASTRGENGIEPRVACVQKFGMALSRELTDMIGRYEDIIVDAGGHDSVELRSASTVATTLVSPIQASQFDLWTINPLQEMIIQAQAHNPNLNVLVLMSRAPTNPNIKDVEEAAQLIKEAEGLKLANSVICERMIFRRAAGAGKSVVEHGPQSDRGVAEMIALYNEVYGS